MKNASKKSWPVLFKMFLLLAFLAQATPSISLSAPTIEEVSCPAPSVVKTAHSSGFISFSWGSGTGATEYKAWYVRHNDNFTSQVITTGSTSISYSGLLPGNYSFYFQTVCGEDTSSYVIIDDLMM